MLEMHEQHTMRFDGRVEEGPSERVGKGHGPHACCSGPRRFGYRASELLAAEGASRSGCGARGWGVLRCGQQYHRRL